MVEEQEKEEIVENILQITDTLFRDLLPILPKEWIRLDLTMSQLKVVLLLFINGPSRMSVIASAIGVSLATATGVVDRLIERGLLIRNGDPDDRRVVICSLSKKGEKLIRGLWQLSQKRMGYLLKTIDTPQLRLITEALQSLLQSASVNKDGPQKV